LKRTVIGEKEVSPMQDNPQALHVRLIWQDVATGEGKEYAGPLPITLGRATDNTVVLNSNQISRHHSTLVAEQGGIVLRDNNSVNGTFIEGERITSRVLSSGANFQIEPFHFTMTVVPAYPHQAAAQLGIDALETIIMKLEGTLPDVSVSEIDAEASLAFSPLTGQLTSSSVSKQKKQTPPVEAFSQSVVSIQDFRQRQIPFQETTYLAVGAGLGSFTWVDHLRIYGVPADQIVALGPEPRPNARYETLCLNSQIPPHERLRSHSDSCPDNIWGWPTYAQREVARSLRTGQLVQALKIAGWVLGEPVISYTYTPRSGDVFKSLDNETRRIGWDRIWQNGWAEAIRKTDDGRYMVAYMRHDGRGNWDRQYIVARYVHLAMGYPAIRTLPDLQAYRIRTNDTIHAVNAYEPHNHVYEHLARHGGVVMVRGRGIVASRVIQRLYEILKQDTKNPKIFVMHLHRSPVVIGHNDGVARRKVKNYTELQPFNWPKSCWGGVMLLQMQKADDKERDQLLNIWGGTTTADRTDWQRLSEKGVLEGWYQNIFGEVKSIEQAPDGKLLTHISRGQPNQPESTLTLDFMIDCTGAEASLNLNPFLKDMIDSYGLKRNPKDRLKVTNDFEVIGMQNGSGHVYASGVLTLGGPHAAVDSFLGLQYAAIHSVENLTKLGAPGLRPLTPLRSFTQWVRWTQGAQP
jgi:pSer/pThr/pTyr-binding forkhead associated (FHA) protein